MSGKRYPASFIQHVARQVGIRTPALPARYFPWPNRDSALLNAIAHRLGLQDGD